MFERLLSVAMLIGLGYWYWSGPYQDRVNPDMDARLGKYAEDMRSCVHGLNYKAGATGEGSGDPQIVCAKRLNLYLHEGQWHSYDDVRQR